MRPSVKKIISAAKFCAKVTTLLKTASKEDQNEEAIKADLSPPTELPKEEQPKTEPPIVEPPTEEPEKESITTTPDISPEIIPDKIEPEVPTYDMSETIAYDEKDKNVFFEAVPAVEKHVDVPVEPPVAETRAENNSDKIDSEIKEWYFN